MSNRSTLLFYTIISILIFIEISGCTKLVEVNAPATQISSSDVYNSDLTAAGVLTGLYTSLSSTNYGNSASIPTISLYAGLSADEYKLWSTGSDADLVQLSYYQNSLTPERAGIEFWENIYPYIYTCNQAIQGLSSSTSISSNVRQQLLGEAKFMRAFFYFYLVNLYGDIPLILSPDYKINSTAAKSPASSVYQQIIADLIAAKSSLVDGYVMSDAKTLYSSSSAERTRPNKYAASALLARAYLYINDYADAKAEADSVISNSTYYSLTDLNSVFLKNSNEAIWQLQPVTNGGITNTAEAVEFIISYPPSGIGYSHPVYLSQNLLNSFETGDKRAALGTWINSYTDTTGTYYYAYKYKDATIGIDVSPTEYTMMLRLGEQYLIRAEAEANGAGGGMSSALQDLNVVRSRAGLPATTSTDQAQLVASIIHERQVELFTEMGQRWLDLKRTGLVNPVMDTTTAQKGGTWSSFQSLYPIPKSEIVLDPNLTQNPGYF